VRLPGPLSRGIASAIARVYLRRPEQTHAIHALLQRASVEGLVREGLAQVSFLLGSDSCFAAPQAVRIEVSSRCNLKCPICPQVERMSRPKQLFDYDLYLQILQSNPQIRELALFNWGEPLLHPRFADFVAAASARGIHTSTVTNGVLLDGRRAAELIEAGIDAVYVSIDDVGARYQAIRGVPYERTIGNVRELVLLARGARSQLFVGASVTLSSQDPGVSERVITELTSLGVDAVEIVPCQEYSPTHLRRGPCIEPYRYLVVLSDGRVTPCCVDFDGVLAYGSVLEEPDLRVHFHSERARALRRSTRSVDTLPDLCRSCSFREIRPLFSSR
jgi:radical SAM protein with 4Fe4S-binding SPASM domain